MGKIIQRTAYINKLWAYKDHDLIKVITGFRRSGKCTLFKLYQNRLRENGVPETQIVSLNFEEFENQRFLDDFDGLCRHIVQRINLSNP